MAHLRANHERLAFVTNSAARTPLKAGARFIAANDDSTFPYADGLLPGNGAIVAAVATASGVQPEIAGKPHPAMAQLVRAKLGSTGIVVGDRPETDGMFARSMGYLFGLVLSGVTSLDDLPVSPTPEVIANDLAELLTMAPELGVESGGAVAALKALEK